MFGTLAVLAAQAAIGAAPCALAASDLMSAGWTASAALSEHAEQVGVPEHRAGGVAIFWRQGACDLLNFEEALLPETLDAIESECSRVVHLPQGSETAYVEAVRASLSERESTLISVAWAERPVVEGGVRHVFLVSDGVNAVRTVSPGYGRAGQVVVTCERSAWSLATAEGQ